MEIKEEKDLFEEPIYQEIIIKFKEGTSQEEIENFFKEQKDTSKNFSTEEPRRSFASKPEELDELQKATDKDSEKKEIPSLKLFWRVRLTEPVGDTELDNLVEEYSRADEIVAYAARAGLPGPPPAPGDYLNLQRYLDQPTQVPPQQGGVGATWAWKEGWKGADVRVCDCEYGFVNHKDLRDLQDQSVVDVIFEGDGNYDKHQHRGHGTSVLGILAGQDNGQGVIGICHQAEILFASQSGTTQLDCLNAVGQAVLDGDLQPGDVVLLEMQTKSKLPVEYEPDIHTLVTTLVYIQNIVVVAAAGNGDWDLDDQTARRDNLDKYIWRKEHGNEDDSGAILVGAGHAATVYSDDFTPHAKTSTSNYGSRVDCQGWGNMVVTTGGGDLYSNDGSENWYTESFSDTSSAAAIVAGVVACLQGYAKDSHGSAVKPKYIRELLQNEVNGTPQPKDDDPHIGPLPDLYRLIPAVNKLDPKCFIDIGP